MDDDDRGTDDIREAVAADLERMGLWPEAQRYDDGTDRCAECAAIVPDAEPFGVGTLRRPVEHRAWCPTLRRLEPTEQPLPPGPIWTNGAADDDRPYSAAQLQHARERARDVRTQQGKHANAWFIGFVASGAATDPAWPTPGQRAMLAALDLELDGDR